MQPTSLQIFESIGRHGAISEVAATNVRALLEANWRVSVVAADLCEALRPHVEWIPLHVPKKLFAYKWLSARHFLLKARGKTAFDVVHAHQPQISDSVDVFQCHYLTRAAAQSGSLPSWKGRQGFSRAQEEIVLRAEDRFYRRLSSLRGPRAPQILFNSPFTQQNFVSIYGEPQSSEILLCAAPDFAPPTPAQRAQARQKWAPEAAGKIVLGFMGGNIERKGYKRVLDAAARCENVFLLFGGPYADQIETPQRSVKNVGFIEDKASFFAACDALVMASEFEPLGVIAFEAASFGVPTIALASVGALEMMRPENAALEWGPHDSLDALGAKCRENAEAMRRGAQKVCEKFGRAAYNAHLVSVCESVAAKKNRYL